MTYNIRLYGKGPYQTAVIHGGPGAAGEMAPVAETLCSIRGVLEPLQTADSIEGQIEELASILRKFSAPPVVLIGYSWGAWLGIMIAAEYPALIGKLILVGSGPLEEQYVPAIRERRLQWLTETEKARVDELEKLLTNPCAGDKQAIFSEFGKLMSKADGYDMFPETEADIDLNAVIFHNVMTEAQEWRKNGRLLDAARKIQCPVVAVHGVHDPHPCQGVREPFLKVNKNIQVYLLKKCGHTPWKEKWAKDIFYTIINQELNG